MIEFLLQPGQRLFARYPVGHPALHRADDGRGPEAPSEVDDGPGEVPGAHPDVGVGIGEAQLSGQPTGAGPHGGELKSVLAQQRAEFHRMDVVRVGGEELDRIESRLRRLGATLCEASVEDEGTASGFGDETDGDRGTNHGADRGGENGARCRFRTCDPLRVKQVLYH